MPTRFQSFHRSAIINQILANRIDDFLFGRIPERFAVERIVRYSGEIRRHQRLQIFWQFSVVRQLVSPDRDNPMLRMAFPYEISWAFSSS